MAKKQLAIQRSLRLKLSSDDDYSAVANEYTYNVNTSLNRRTFDIRKIIREQIIRGIFDDGITLSVANCG